MAMAKVKVGGAYQNKETGDLVEVSKVLRFQVHLTDGQVVGYRTFIKEYKKAVAA